MVVDPWPQSIVMRGTPIRLIGTGFLVPELGEQELTIISNDGRIAAISVQLQKSGELRGEIDDSFLNVFAPGTKIVGRAQISRTLFEGPFTTRVDLPVSIDVVSELTPVATQLRTRFEMTNATLEGTWYPGDELVISGSGFLLQGEGPTIVQLRGSFESLTPPETLPLDVVLPLNAARRDELSFTLTPDLLGVRPGTFRGELVISNESLAGATTGSGLEDLERRLEPPRIETVSPPLAARGQNIVVSGRGFLPTDPFYESTTLIRLEGAFTTLQTSQELLLEGPTALALFPDLFESNTAMKYILRVTQTPGGELEGLGLIAGSFVGRISPMIISGAETILGEGIDLSLTIALQRQVVFVKFLPGFSTTVAEMGLELREGDIRRRILDVCARDYAGVNIEFRDQRPTDFAEYSLIEVGGADPNGQGLFGLDNTAGKDVGNLRFNDIIGGANADTAEQGYFAFGGVFVRSFFQLSPTLGREANLPIASSRFDDIFAPFMPSLGGVPAEPIAAATRRALADKAVAVLGNVVGNTVVHEIGHSLGLTNIDGEYHNLGDNPGWIMDSGNFRPFAERAEIDGENGAVFAPFDRDYLQRILPTN